MFTSSERRANQLKSVKKIEMGDPRIGKLVEKNEMHVQKLNNIGKLVKRIETGGLQARKIMKKVETGDRKVVDLVEKIQVNEPKVGKVWRSVRIGQEEYLNI